MTRTTKLSTIAAFTAALLTAASAGPSGVGAPAHAQSAGQAFVDRLKGGASAAYSYVVSGARDIWRGIKSLSCGQVIEGFSRFDLTTVLLERLWSPGATCLNEFRKGFLCGIPDMVVTLGSLAWNIGKSAWDNKLKCTAAAALALPVAPAAFMGCGAYYYGKAQVSKIGRCLASLKGSAIWGVLWQELWKLGCNVAGGLLLDLVIDTLSAGAGLPASIARWVKKLGTALSPSTWMRIASTAGQKSADAAISYAQSVAGRFSECR